MRCISLAASVFLGGAIGVPLGLALSQTAPQMRVQVLLQRRTTDIPLPANLEVRDDRWDPGAETGEHEHPGPVILVVSTASWLRKSRLVATFLVPARRSGDQPTEGTTSRI